MSRHLDGERSRGRRGECPPGAEVEDEEDEEDDDGCGGRSDDRGEHPRATAAEWLSFLQRGIYRGHTPAESGVERRQHDDHPHHRADDPHELPERMDPLGLRPGRGERGVGARKLEGLLQERPQSIRAHGRVVDGGWNDCFGLAWSVCCSCAVTCMWSSRPGATSFGTRPLIERT